MAGWFVDRVMDRLFNTCCDYLQHQYFGGRTGMKEGLERLRENHPLIQDVVSAYSQGKITDRYLNNWLWQLRDAVDEADDVLDDFEYMKLKEQLELNKEQTKVRFSVTSVPFEPARKLRKVYEQGLKSDPNMERLHDAVQKLDRVSAQVNTFLHLVEKKEEEQQAKDQQLYEDRASGSLPGPVFIGRDQEKEIVMQWLRKPSSHNLSLLSIVGHGGMGKTTLLQNIYADEITKKFDLQIWVCVSNGFVVEEIITDMLKYLDEWSPHLTKLPPLQEKLNSVTRSKKFLLVLDDIWEETTTTKWEKVISPLTNGKLGSKVLVTTRMYDAASGIADIIKNEETFTLKGLEEAQCLMLLKTHAFARMESFREDKTLMCIAKEIVKKLSGSPLATKVIGGVLKYDLTPKHWERVLRSKFRSVEVFPGQNINPNMPILRLSLSFLPQPLQNCFAFCGIFPQDYQFDKDDLVRMWIALGFIQESFIEGETLEDIGGRYFDVLVRKSFFDEFQDYQRIYYKMHDLLHDLAEFISSEECFRFVGGNVSSFRIPTKNVRHLFVETGNLEVFRMIKDVKNLHSLFLTNATNNQDFTDILAKIFMALKSIRLLFIVSTDLEKMPDAIGNLRHLRYLNLRVHLTQMPRSLSSLYHLQFIICRNKSACFDDFLPKDVSNLSNLRHLLGLVPNLLSSVRGIGKLRSLQELNEFNVKNENGYRIRELEYMSELRKLKINFLENVKDAGEAQTAKLFEKRKLTDLFLNWGNTIVDDGGGSRQNIINPDLDLDVLENLKPNKNLKRLSISSNMGVSCARWMYNADLIYNLEYISLNGCSWETLPPFGQLPHLKSLYLCNMPKVKQLDNKVSGNDKICVFPALEVLYMKGLHVLEDWFDGADDCFFPCLTELFLDNCPNLPELPYLPPKIKKIKLQNIGWKAALICKQETNNCCLESLEVLSCPNITSLLTVGGLQQVESGIEKFQLIVSEVVIDNPSLLPTVSIASLEKLTICNNDALDSCTIMAEQWFLHVRSSLRELSFEFLNSLQSLASSLERLCSLKILHFLHVPQLQQLLHIPASLERLQLKKLNSLQCLPSSLAAISSLEDLFLYEIPLLESLPDLPSSLDSLHLSDLYNLQCLPSSLWAISSLKVLLLWYIPLKSLPDLPSSLDTLNLRGLDNLECLPSSLSDISSLKELHLERIPLLNSLPNLPSSLEKLCLSNLRNLQCLPSSLSAISSLKKLKLESISRLKSLPDLPSSMNSITIKYCHPELVKRNKRISGSDWHKIAHIRRVHIV